MEKRNSIVQAVYRTAVSDPGRFCLADGKTEWTYGEFWEHIVSGAVYLKARTDICPGDAVVIRNSQNAAFITAVLAVQLLGGISVPTEKNISPERMEEICETVGAVYCLADRNLPETRPGGPLRDLITQETEITRTDFQKFGKMADEIREHSTAEILFTTGTTGKSKGIVLTHASVIAVAENVIDGVEMKPSNIELIPVPLSHSHGLRRLYANLLNKSAAVLTDGVVFINTVFRLMNKYHVTALDLVPAALSAILRLNADELGTWNGKIDYVQLGSAPIPEKDKQELMRLLPDARLYNFYGTTESGCSCILNFNDGVIRTDCIGRATRHAHFAFFTEDGKMTVSDRNHPALLGCRGEMNMLEYYQSPFETASIMTEDGYIITQDMGWMDEKGLIWLIGRIGDVITSGGTKIAPKEIEEAANSVKGIRETVCVPVPDVMLGQVPLLFYVLEDSAGEDFAARMGNGTGGTLTEQAENLLYEALASRLEGYKIPRYYRNIPEIPRTYNGKIRRNILREMAEKRD